MMNASIFWARLLGLYTAILALWCYSTLNHLYPLLIDFSTNPLSLMGFGIFTVLLGLAILVSHHVFRGWPTLVTLLGYWITLKGIVLLFFPQCVNQIVQFWQYRNMTFVPLPALLIGLILIYCGFIRKH